MWPVRNSIRTQYIRDTHRHDVPYRKARYAWFPGNHGLRNHIMDGRDWRLLFITSHSGKIRNVFKKYVGRSIFSQTLKIALCRCRLKNIKDWKQRSLYSRRLYFVSVRKLWTLGGAYTSIQTSTCRWQKCNGTTQEIHVSRIHVALKV